MYFFCKQDLNKLSKTIHVYSFDKFVASVMFSDLQADFITDSTKAFEKNQVSTSSYNNSAVIGIESQFRCLVRL